MDFTIAEEQALIKYSSASALPVDIKAESVLNELWELIHPSISYAVAADLSPLRRPTERYEPLLSMEGHLRLYTLVHDYMTKHPLGANSTRGARLYGRIFGYMQKCMGDLIGSSELTDAVHVVRFVENRAFQMSNCSALGPLRYLDRHWGRRIEDHGKEIIQSRNLLSYLTQTYFVPKVGRKVAKATCSLTLTQPSFLLFSTPFVRSLMLSQLDVDEVSALERRTTKRPVYCCTTVLEQSAYASSFFCQFPGAHHWAIQIGAQEPSTTTGIQGPDHQVAEAETGQCLMILELERDGEDIKSRVTYAPRHSAHQAFLGYTMYSNREIESFANDVIGSMRADYHVARNNCQVFCNGIADCILIPSTGSRIFYRESELPGPARKRVLHYRFWDYTQATMKDEISPQSFPFSAQDLSSGVIDALSASALLASWNQDQKATFFMWFATLYMIGWNSHVGIFRHLPMIRRNHKEELEKLYTIAYQAKLSSGGRLQNHT